jgi:hypothetical protein
MTSSKKGGKLDVFMKNRKKRESVEHGPSQLRTRVDNIKTKGTHMPRHEN